MGKEKHSDLSIGCHLYMTKTLHPKSKLIQIRVSEAQLELIRKAQIAYIQANNQPMTMGFFLRHIVMLEILGILKMVELSASLKELRP